MDDFLKNLKKMVRIVLYGPAISQSDCRKTSPNQLPCNNKSKFFKLVPVSKDANLASATDLPGDSKLWESPDEADIVWWLFIQILFL